MLPSFTKGLLLALLLAATAVATTACTSCNLPIKYSIGNVDSRFKISRDEVLRIAKDAESRWDTALGKNVFEYDLNALMKINLVYDERQATIDKLATLKKLAATVDKLISDYEADLGNYNMRVSDHTSRVNYWNRMGGAPSYTYNLLTNERRQLENDRIALDNRERDIRKLEKERDAQLVQYKNDVAKLEGSLDQNKNKTIVRGQYVYDGMLKRIDIFAFESDEKLRFILMHELGHSLGLDETESPASIMYPLGGDRNLSDPKPTQEDIQLVNSKCKLN